MLKLKKPKIYIPIISSFIIGFLCFLGFNIPKTYAAETAQITLKNTINHELKNMEDFEFNGIIYYYLESFDRIYAKSVSNPEQVVIYNKLSGKTVMYAGSFDLNGTETFGDIIVYDSNNFGSNFKNKTIKNLYMIDNYVSTNYQTMTIENYHYIPSYKLYSSQINYSSDNVTKFNALAITNCYYYEWNKLFFKEYADEYNSSSDKAHNFTMKTESESKYTKESFYPFEGFIPTLETQGVKYFHASNSSYLPDCTTNEEIPYEPYEVDSRIKSITVPKLTSAAAFNNITFNTFDARGQNVSTLSGVKGETIIGSNASSNFSTTNIRFKKLYFVYDPNAVSITSVSTYGTVSLEKIYIPEEFKEHFNAIIESEVLGSKVEYYNGEINTTFEFRNDESTKIYKSSDNSLNLTKTLETIKILEKSGVNVPTDGYINEFLENYTELPDIDDKDIDNEQVYSLREIGTVYCPSLMDPRKILTVITQNLVLKHGETTNDSATINFNVNDFTFNHNGQIKYTCIFLDRTKEEGTFNVEYINIQNKAGYVIIDDSIYMVTSVAETKTLDAYFTEFNEIVTKFSNITLSEDITLTAGVYTVNYSSDTVSGSIYLTVAKINLNVVEQEYNPYDLALRFVFTKYVDIDKAILLMKPYMLYKDGKPCTENYILTFSKISEDHLEFIGMYPNGMNFSYQCNFRIIDSNVGQFFASSLSGTCNFTLMVEAKTIKEGTTAKDLYQMIMENVYSNQVDPVFNLAITLTKPGISSIESSIYKSGNGQTNTATARVVVTDSDINPDGFKEEFHTIKDDFGNSGIIDQINDNPTLKWTSITISTIFGFILLYLSFLGIRKFIRWLRR